MPSPFCVPALGDYALAFLCTGSGRSCLRLSVCWHWEIMPSPFCVPAVGDHAFAFLCTGEQLGVVKYGIYDMS
jgi:hypothetical protein